MLSHSLERTAPAQIMRHGVSSPATDLLRVAAIIACFAVSTIAASHFAHNPGAARDPLSQDWHGNVARSGG